MIQMSYKKLNNYTWVQSNGKDVDRYKNLMNKQSVSKSSNYLHEKKNRRPVDQKKLYTKFIRDVFADRKFICRTEFHGLIIQKFNSNTTYYRKRMIDLGLITETNNLIKPFNNANRKEKNV